MPLPLQPLVISTIMTLSDAVDDEEDFATEELELLVATGDELLDELATLLGSGLDELVARLDELLVIAAELVVAGGLLEWLPPPPQAETNKPRVNTEITLRLRIMTPFIVMVKNGVRVNYTIS